MMKDTLAERDGQLYILSEDSRYAEPILNRAWYPLNMSSHGYKNSYGAEKIGQTLTPFGVPSAGIYQDEDGLRYQLPDCGQTKPTFWETEEIHCPKVRKGTETRYRDGHWQKLTKAYGWVNIS